MYYEEINEWQTAMIDCIIKTKKMPRPVAERTIEAQKPSCAHPAEKKCRAEGFTLAGNIREIIQRHKIIEAGYLQ